MRTGDLVTFARRPGVWAVVERVPSRCGARWRVTLTDGARVLDVGEAGMTLVTRPHFAPGSTVQHRSRPATVIADDGGPAVRIFQQGTRQLHGGEPVDASGEVDAFRWALAAENAASLT